MIYRHEKKFVIEPLEFMSLERKISKVMKRDPNTGGEKGYWIRSIYFDNPYMKAYGQKINGDLHRFKFRVRVYNRDFNNIKLECKSRNNTMTGKISAKLTIDELNQIFDGEYEFLLGKEGELYNAFYVALTTERLRPKAIIEYYRMPFIYSFSNLRVTFDTKLSISNKLEDFFFDGQYCQKVSKQSVVLEVKFNHMLPVFIRNLLQFGHKTQTATSKYGLAVEGLPTVMQ